LNERDLEIVRTRPGWTRVLPWIGKTPPLTRRQWRVLGLLGTAELFESYDLGLLTLALLQIQAGLGIAEHEIGSLVSFVRLGVLPALLAGILADRFGRRRLLLGTVLAFTLTTFLTAFVQTPAQFAAVQFLTRACLYAETSLAVVVLAEELSARDRGWGLGVLGALGALGHGVAALVFAFVELLPFGWRALYALGALPLLAIAWLRRGLPETDRFAQARATRPESWREPVRALLRMYPGRLALLLAAVLPLEFVAITASTFMAKTLQEVHGWSPAGVTVLYVVGGALAIVGNVAAGLWSDRIGRRATIAVLVVAYGGACFGFYNSAGWAVAPLWIGMIFASQGAAVLFKALGSELFPTSYRSTASVVRAAVGTLFGSLGLWLESQLYPAAGSHGAVITWLLPLLALTLLVAWRLPETATRELEEIAPER
jgi:putative MFS transporter